MTIYVKRNQKTIDEEIASILTKGSGQFGRQLLQTKTSDEAGRQIGVAFRNKLINGGFDVWQRGTSQTYTSVTSTQFGPDRWNIAGSGWSALNVTQSRQTFAPGQKEVPGNPKYYWRILCNSQSGSGDWRIAQSIENVETGSGRNMVVSFWARSNGANTTIANTRLFQVYGGGGSSVTNDGASVMFFDASRRQGGSGPNPIITQTWKKFVGYIHLPSIEGKTVGTSSSVPFDLYYPPVAGVSLDFANFQIEEDYLTPFERRPLYVELPLCQRYFYSTLRDANGALKPSKSEWQGIGTGNYIIFGESKFPTTMRTSPTVTLAAYSLDSGGTEQGDGRNGIMYYKSGGTTGYYTHTYGYSVQTNPNSILSVYSGENSDLVVASSTVTVYTAGYTASAEFA